MSRKGGVSAGGTETGAKVGASRLPRRAAVGHAVHGAVCALVAPLWTPVAALYLRFGMGYRVRALRETRAAFQRVRAQCSGPLLICANHLTLVDSFLIAWALGSSWHYAFRPSSLPWNTPELSNFAASPLQAIAAYLAKCIPIARGGQREATGAVLNRVTHLLGRGELALVFPEGGRSRSGRVEPDSAAWGVGRIVGALPACRVACVYMRGDAQQSWSRVPVRGERFSVRIAAIEPKSDHRGPRRSRDIARQITARLARMEREYFDGRQ